MQLTGVKGKSESGTKQSDRHITIAIELIQRGARVDIINHHGLTPFDLVKIPQVKMQLQEIASSVTPKGNFTLFLCLLLCLRHDALKINEGKYVTCSGKTSLGVTSFLLSRNQYCKLFLSNTITHGIPI